MGIQIGAAPVPSPGALLYVRMARALAALSMSERMQLLSAFTSGTHFTSLPPRQRAMFDALAAMQAPKPGEPW